VGAIALAEGPLTVPQIARRMGITRQSVHATVKRLVADGLVELAPNLDHRRSQLVRLTELGERSHAALDGRQARMGERASARDRARGARDHGAGARRTLRTARGRDGAGEERSVIAAMSPGAQRRSQRRAHLLAAAVLFAYLDLRQLQRADLCGSV
jgi:DNA-binding MarR family transcriptional regulator